MSEVKEFVEKPTLKCCKEGGSVIKSLQKEEPSAELIQRYRSEYAEQGNEENTTP